MEARDFWVQIGVGSAPGYEVSLRTPDGGEAAAPLRLPVTIRELEALAGGIPNAVIASSASVRRSISSDEQPVRRLGAMLFDALLAEGGGLGTFAACRSQVDRDGGQLRMVLQIRPPELERLPWEFLFDPREDEYVCLNTPLIRRPQVLLPARPLQVTAPLRILCMTARPVDQEALATADEERRLRDTLSDLEQSGRVELGWVNGQTWRDLRHAMRRGPWHVFHFIGHGGFDSVAQQGTLALADEGGGSTYHLGADDLAMLLRGHPSLRLVLLNACDTGRASALDPFSSVAGALIRRGIPAVLAMQFAITDRAALEFGRTFYESLADRYPVDACVTQARQAIRLALPGSLEWGTPVLYMRSADGDLFDLTDSPVGSHADRPAAEQARPAEQEEVPAAPSTSDDGRLAGLYTAGLSALYTGRWDEAVEAFRVLLADGCVYKDAERRLAEAQRGKRLASLYAAGCAAVDAGNWADAVNQLGAVIAAEPGYRDAEELLNRARSEQAAAPLYAEIAALHDAGQWQAVVALGERIQALIPDKADPDGWVSSARTQLESARPQGESAPAERVESGAQPESARRGPRGALPAVRVVTMATVSAGAKVHSIAFSPDGERLALGCGKHQVSVVDLTGRRRLKARHGSGEQAVRGVSYDPAGGRLATVGDDAVARIWDANDRSRLGKLIHDRVVLSVAFSPDGRTLATGSADAAARIWDAATGTRLLRVRHENKVPCVVFSPDGRLLATASWDETARIWDARSGEQRVEMVHKKAVMGVAFSPDGQRLATAGWDGGARIWDAISGEQRLEVHPGEHVWGVTFSGDGRVLATASSDGLAQAWAAETGDLLFEVIHADVVSCVAFSPDGRVLATGSLDETAQIWRLLGDDHD
jgi:hypothetical protein